MKWPLLKIAGNGTMNFFPFHWFVRGEWIDNHDSSDNNSRTATIRKQFYRGLYDRKRGRGGRRLNEVVREQGWWPRDVTGLACPWAIHNPDIPVIHIRFCPVIGWHAALQIQRRIYIRTFHVPLKRSSASSGCTQSSNRLKLNRGTVFRVYERSGQKQNFWTNYFSTQILWHFFEESADMHRSMREKIVSFKKIAVMLLLLSRETFFFVFSPMYYNSIESNID